MDKRWSHIQTLWQSTPALYVIAGFLIGLLFFPAIEAFSTDASDFLAGFVPEAVGIGFTVLLIDRLNQRRERDREEREVKARLVREARSTVNNVAVQAINSLYEQGWLEGENGLLQNAQLDGANLQGANFEFANLASIHLIDANLAGARFWRTNLRDARLIGTNLVGSRLGEANLQGAYLRNANLSNARLWGADLAQAQLWGANLQGVNFEYANLFGVDIENATLDENVKLPDGTNWTPATDMRRFTDPNHPDFWQPDWLKTQNVDND